MNRQQLNYLALIISEHLYDNENLKDQFVTSLSPTTIELGNVETLWDECVVGIAKAMVNGRLPLAADYDRRNPGWYDAYMFGREEMEKWQR